MPNNTETSRHNRHTHINICKEYAIESCTDGHTEQKAVLPVISESVLV